MPLVAIAPALVAVLAILLWWASANMVRWLSSAIPDWGIPGLGNLRGAVQASAGWIIGETQDWLHAIMAPIESIFAGPIIAMFNTFSEIRNTVTSLSGLVQWIKNTWVIQWVQNLTAYAYGLYAAGNTYSAALFSMAEGEVNTLRDYAIALSQTAYTQAVGTATGLINDLRAYSIALSQTAYTQAVGAATGLFTRAEADAAGLFTAASASIAGTESLARGLFAAAESDIGRTLAAAESYALTTVTQQIGALVTDIDQSIVGAFTGVWDDVDQAIDGVIGVAGTADADILAALRAIPRSVPFDIAGIASLAGVTTLALTRYLKECGIPNCKNLSQFGSDLQSLLSIVNDASFVALLVELIHNPSSASGIVNDTFGPAINTGVSSAKSLLGV